MPEKLDLAPLREQFGAKPRTKYGQVKQAWPEIQQLRAEGQTIKDIWQLVRQCGISIGYGRFAGYVRQLTRATRPGAPATTTRTAPTPDLADPLQSIREGRRKPFFNPAPEEGLRR